jgi:ribonuclease HI
VAANAAGEVLAERSICGPTGGTSFYAELLAVYDVLRHLPVGVTVALHIDNAAVLACLSAHLSLGSRSCFRHAELDLQIATADAYRSLGTAITSVKVKAHSGVPLNERADSLARDAAGRGLPPSQQLDHFSAAHSLLHYIAVDLHNTVGTVDSVLCLVACHVTSRELFRMHSLLQLLRGRSELPVQGLCCSAPSLSFLQWLHCGGLPAQSSSIPRLHCSDFLSGDEWRSHGRFAVAYIHRILPTRAHRVHLRQAASAACPRCAADETFAHVFSDVGCIHLDSQRVTLLRSVERYLTGTGLQASASHHLAASLLSAGADRTPALLFDATAVVATLVDATRSAISNHLSNLDGTARAHFWSGLSKQLLIGLSDFWGEV